MYDAYCYVVLSQTLQLAMSSNSQKRVKFYHIPSDSNGEAKIRHSTFLSNATGKISVRNRFVTVSNFPSSSAANDANDSCPDASSFPINPIDNNEDLTSGPLDNDNESGSNRRPRARVCIILHISLPLYLNFVQDEPLLAWLHERDRYLAEFIMMEGRGDAFRQEHCIECASRPAEYQCCDCLGQELFCKGCIVANHARAPLHMIKVKMTPFN